MVLLRLNITCQLFGLFTYLCSGNEVGCFQFTILFHCKFFALFCWFTLQRVLEFYRERQRTIRSLILYLLSERGGIYKIMARDNTSLYQFLLVALDSFIIKKNFPHYSINPEFGHAGSLARTNLDLLRECEARSCTLLRSASSSERARQIHSMRSERATLRKSSINQE